MTSYKSIYRLRKPLVYGCCLTSYCQHHLSSSTRELTLVTSVSFAHLWLVSLGVSTSPLCRVSLVGTPWETSTLLCRTLLGRLSHYLPLYVADIRSEFFTVITLPHYVGCSCKIPFKTTFESFPLTYRPEPYPQSEGKFYQILTIW